MRQARPEAQLRCGLFPRSQDSTAPWWWLANSSTHAAYRVSLGSTSTTLERSAVAASEVETTEPGSDWTRLVQDLARRLNRQKTPFAPPINTGDQDILPNCKDKLRARSQHGGFGRPVCCLPKMDAMLDRARSAEPASGRGQAVTKAVLVVTLFSPTRGPTEGSDESGRGGAQCRSRSYSQWRRSDRLARRLLAVNHSPGIPPTRRAFPRAADSTQPRCRCSRRPAICNRNPA